MPGLTALLIVALQDLTLTAVLLTAVLRAS
jgi:hypothetical protein